MLLELTNTGLSRERDAGTGDRAMSPVKYLVLTDSPALTDTAAIRTLTLADVNEVDRIDINELGAVERVTAGTAKFHGHVQVGQSYRIRGICVLLEDGELYAYTAYRPESGGFDKPADLAFSFYVVHSYEQSAALTFSYEPLDTDSLAQVVLNEVNDQLAGDGKKTSAAIINNSSSIFDHKQTLNDHETRITAVNNLAKNNQNRHAAAELARDELARDVSTIDATTKKLALAISSEMETSRSFRREFGQDGVYRVKSSDGRNQVPFYDQTHDVSYSSLNHHNHWDTHNVNGVAQFSIVVAGVYIQMRHTDYSRRQPVDVGGSYLETREIDYPSVPIDIDGDVAAQVAKAKQYFLAREDESLRAGLADFAGAHQVYMAYVEVYPEKLNAAELETFVGSRHQLNATSVVDAFNEFAYWDWTGLQDPLQNYANFPLLVHGFDDDGDIAFGSWKARMCFAPIGSYEDYPLHEICTESEDYLSDIRYGDNSDRTRLDRFDVEAFKLREIVGKIPGLDGYGTQVSASFKVGATNYAIKKYGTNNDLNAGMYHDMYSLVEGDADGRSHKQLGFSRSSFVAHNTRDEILSVANGGNTAKISMMTPIELVVVDFRQEWNPHGLADDTGITPYAQVNPKATTAGRSAEKALNGYQKIGLLFYKTPAELYSGFGSSDPADTASAYLWIKDKNGNPKQVSPSGVPPELPKIDGKQLRQRYMIYKVYDEGSIAYREMRERFKSQDTGIAAAVINNTVAEFDNKSAIKALAQETRSLTAYRKQLESDYD